MRRLFGMLATTALLCGCSSKEQDSRLANLETKVDSMQGQIAALQAANSNLVARLEAANSIASNSEAAGLTQIQSDQIKVWTLAQIETAQTINATKRYELKTNLLDIINQAAMIAIESKQKN